MGVYLVSADDADWAEDELLLNAAPLLGKALKARGLPGYDGPPSSGPIPPGEGDHFEEKLYRPHRSYIALLGRYLTGDALANILYWDMLIPVEFDGVILLDTASAYEDTTTVASSTHILKVMKTVAADLDLPIEQVPRRSDNLDIGTWFDDVETGDAQAPQGLWRDDPDAAYYVAVYLRAAQFSLRRSCPMRYV